VTTYTPKRYLATHLIELNMAIDDLQSWATHPDEIAQLRRLEELRDQVLAVLQRQHDRGKALGRLLGTAGDRGADEPS
jgi:hypothetical protein